MFDVLHVSASIDPRHGGPSKTVPALAAAQAALGARVALVTLTPGDPAALGSWGSEVDHSPTEPSTPAAPPADLRHSSFVIRHFPAAPGPAGSAFCFSAGLAAFLATASARCIHAHGLWLRPLHHAARAARRLRAPLVLAPRGMLEPWAIGHHAWKKRLAAALIHPGAIPCVTAWHATADSEAENLRRIPAWLRAPAAAPVRVASNGIAAPSPAAAGPDRSAWLAAYPKLRDTRVALFYGRFHRKKRVAELIDLWRSRPRPGWTLLVAGLPGDHTVAELAARAGDDPVSAVVVADGCAMPPPYALSSLFLLPSHSENFGQAVAEALAAGVPALVTDTLPWRELDSVGAGRCVAWADYGAAMDTLLALPAADLAARGAAGRVWVLANFSWASSARRLLDFYPTLRPAPSP